LASAVADPTSRAKWWVQRHLANCPRCQRRAQALGKVHLALSLIKTQPHKFDLVTRANNRAIAVLKRSLRQMPQAEAVCHMLPKPTFIERLRKHTQPVSAAAACLLAVVLLRTGLISSVSRLQRDTERAMRQHCARYLEQETLDDII